MFVKAPRNSRTYFTLPSASDVEILGQLGSLDLHAKNLADMTGARWGPLQKHRPMRVGSLRTRRKRDFVIKGRLEIHANPVDLAAPYRDISLPPADPLF